MNFLIFTKYRCSYCDRAKALIEQKGYEYESINIEDDNNINILPVSYTHLTLPTNREV